jgi:hypothetical protein
MLSMKNLSGKYLPIIRNVNIYPYWQKGKMEYFVSGKLQCRKIHKDYRASEDNLKMWMTSKRNKKSSVTPTHAITSIKQSSVLRGHFFLVLSDNFIW